MIARSYFGQAAACIPRGWVQAGRCSTGDAWPVALPTVFVRLETTVDAVEVYHPQAVAALLDALPTGAMGRRPRHAAAALLARWSLPALDHARRLGALEPLIAAVTPAP